MSKVLGKVDALWMHQRAHLFRLGCVSSPHCPFCPGVQEVLQHLFVRCPRFDDLWALADKDTTHRVITFSIPAISQGTSSLKGYP
jgi:hypothetical protein